MSIGRPCGPTDVILGQAGGGFVIHPGPFQMMNGTWYFAERETYPGA
jgi:hypothetical protein